MQKRKKKKKRRGISLTLFGKKGGEGVKAQIQISNLQWGPGAPMKRGQ